jgi:hypothetical protein
MKALAVLVLFVAGRASAQAPPDPAWSFGVAPHLGLTIPTSRLEPTIVGGVELSVILPVAARRLVLALDVTLARPAYASTGTALEVNGPYSYTVDETELKLALDVLYRFLPAEGRVVPYLGLGGVVQLLKTTETTSLAPGENTQRDSRFGFEAVLGADLRTGPGLLLVETRWVHTDLDHMFTGETNAGNVSISLGFRLVF